MYIYNKNQPKTYELFNGKYYLKIIVKIFITEKIELKANKIKFNISCK